MIYFGKNKVPVRVGKYIHHNASVSSTDSLIVNIRYSSGHFQFNYEFWNSGNWYNVDSSTWRSAELTYISSFNDYYGLLKD